MFYNYKSNLIIILYLYISALKNKLMSSSDTKIIRFAQLNLWLPHHPSEIFIFNPFLEKYSQLDL